MAEPGLAGQLPKMLNATGGNLIAQNNLIINYGTYSQSSPVSSSISDLTGFSASDLYNPATGFQDTTSVKNDFHILSTSPLAKAGTTGGIIGDPRWLKTVTGSICPEENKITAILGNENLKIINLNNNALIQIFMSDGKLLYSGKTVSNEFSMQLSIPFCIIRVTEPDKTTVIKAIR